MFSKIAVAAALISAATAHPSGLECGTDATTRLKLNATVRFCDVVLARL